MTAAAALACAVGAAGCSAAFGLSVEANAGVARLAPDGDGADATAITGGASLALEFDWLRDADLGSGFGVQALRPTGAAGEGADAGVTATPMRSWFASTIGPYGWKVRPRATMGASLANGDGDLYADGYAGIGVSVHPAQGRAIHVLAGPQLVRATDRRLDGATTYQGVGAQLRIRYFRMWWRDCAPATLAAARERMNTRGEWSCR